MSIGQRVSCICRAVTWFNCFSIFRCLVPCSLWSGVVSTIHKMTLDTNKIHYILAFCEDRKALLDEIKNEYLNLDSKNKNDNFEKILSSIKNVSRYEDDATFYIKALLQVVLPFKDRIKICNKLFAKYISKDELLFSKKLYMSLSQIKEMVDAGHEFGLHGYHHDRLGSMTKDEQKNESPRFVATEALVLRRTNDM